MHIERRVLYASFYDEDQGRGQCALVLGWADDLVPVVAYNFGTHRLEHGFNMFTSPGEARQDASFLGPR